MEGGAKSAVEVQGFLKRFGELKATLGGGRYETFVGDFRRVESVLSALRRKRKEFERDTAPQHNLFRVLGIESDEDRTHTPLLADLLNPQGSHAQGSLFLREFLGQCQRNPGFPIPDGDMGEADWRVETQVVTGFGTLDLLIASHRLGYIVVIENKVYAGEQERQLSRYHDWLETQRPFYAKRALVYLTPSGAPSAEQQEIPYSRLSYREDVVSLLQRALPRIDAPRVKETITQYLSIISELGMEATMSYDDEVVQFLSQPENFRLAMEIAQYMPAVRNKALVAFWHRCQENLRRKLEGTDWGKMWKAEIDADDQLPDNDGGIRLTGLDSGDQAPYVYYYLAHYPWSRAYHLYHGLSVECVDDIRTLQSHEMDGLRAALKELGFGSSAESVGWKAIKDYPGKDAFILALSERGDEVAEQGVDVLWSTFESTVGLVEKANTWLRQR